MSIRYGDFLTSRVINGSTITFTQFFPKQFRRQKIVDSVSHLVFPERQRDYIAVRVSVKARSNHDAFVTAMNSLDLLRGIWNLFLNRSRLNRYWGGNRRDPVNLIVLGPTHILHDPKGKPVEGESTWIETTYVDSPRCEDLNKKWKGLRNFKEWVRTQLPRIKYRSIIEDAILRYVRGLDSRDLNTSFVKLWGVLETLTGFGNSSTYSDLIRRVAFLSEDPTFELQVLKHLQTYRNTTVHVGEHTIEPGPETEIVLYQLKWYVERLLEFHLANRFHFNSVDEAAQFMDSPPNPIALSNSIEEQRRNVESLHQRLSLTNKALHFDLSHQRTRTRIRFSKRGRELIHRPN